MSIKLEGTERILRYFQHIGNALPRELGAALYQEAEKVMTVSKAQYVPVDSGALRASGEVLPPEISPGHVSVTLAFGNSSVNYALIVHENLEARHPVGSAKYLEIPLLEAAPRIPGNLAAYLDRQLEKGT
jgi:hypothetical protein